MLFSFCSSPHHWDTEEMEKELIQHHKDLLNAIKQSIPHIKDTMYCFTTEGIPTKPCPDPHNKPAICDKRSAACDTTADPTRLFFHAEIKSPEIPIDKTLYKNFIESDALFVPVIPDTKENSPLSTKEDFLPQLNLENLKTKIPHQMLFRTTSRVKQKLAQPLITLQKIFLNVRSPTDISNEPYHTIFLEKNMVWYVYLFEKYTSLYKKSKIALELLQKISIAFNDEGIPQKFTIEIGGRDLNGDLQNLFENSVLFIDERYHSWLDKSSLIVDPTAQISEGLLKKSLPYMLQSEFSGSRRTIKSPTNGNWKMGTNSLSKQQGGIYFLRVTQQINKVLTYPVQLLQEVITDPALKMP